MNQVSSPVMRGDSLWATENGSTCAANRRRLANRARRRVRRDRRSCTALCSRPSRPCAARSRRDGRDTELPRRRPRERAVRTRASCPGRTRRVNTAVAGSGSSVSTVGSGRSDDDGHAVTCATAVSAIRRSCAPVIAPATPIAPATLLSTTTGNPPAINASPGRVANSATAAASDSIAA